MGEETDIVEPMSSEDVGAAEDVTANEPSKDQPRKRKKHLYKSLKELLEFYLGDANISKNRFINQSIQGKPFVYMDLATFLSFNKVKALTSTIEDLQKAVVKSEVLQLSEDKTQVCRKTPIIKKENEDACTIYVEQIGPYMEHDILVKMFSKYGPIDYVSLPRFPHNGKCKGFAFVEFKDPDFAKKALETFNNKGCCLSPHMAPEDLMSIKNFDSKVEIKNEDGKEKGEENNVVTLDKPKEELNDDNNVGANADGVLQSSEKIVTLKKDKKKRKYSDEFEKINNKKIKKEECLKDEGTGSSASKHKHEGNTSDCTTNNNTLNKSSKQKGKSNVVHTLEDEGKQSQTKSSLEQIARPKVENASSESEDKEGECKRNKRKDSSDKTKALEGEDKNQQSEGSFKKKFKPENEETSDDTGTELSQSEEDGQNKQKKKRKRKKKNKKKSSAISLGLKILSKREWKFLRNKYLNMQRTTMRSLKQHLSYSKLDKNKPEEALGKLDEIKPGTVIKVTLDKPVVDCKASKIELRVHPEIRYVDVTEGECFVYLRTTNPEVAATLLQTNYWPNMELLKGDEETEYWEKMKKDRDEKCFNKMKQNQRGRTKLLKRAERYL